MDYTVGAPPSLGPSLSRDNARTGLLATIAVLMVVLLLLSGCVVSPARMPYRDGDFTSHIASTGQPVAQPAAETRA